MVSVYCPTGVLGEAVNVAVAVSPSAVAGANAVRLNVPGSVGVTLVSAMSTTVPLLSEALTGTLIAVPTRPSSSEQLSAGARWVPRSATLSFANPSHCTDGSKASDAVGVARLDPGLASQGVVGRAGQVLSPTACRGRTRSGRSHRGPSSPLRSVIASSPLNQPDPFGLVGLGQDRRVGRGLGEHEHVAGCDSRPWRLIVRPAVEEPLKNIWTL